MISHSVLKIGRWGDIFCIFIFIMYAYNSKLNRFFRKIPK